MSQAQNGFTVVEVLVTLFVAAVIVTGGYQAYTLIISASQESRNRAEAGNIAYDIMRKQQDLYNGPCAAKTINTDTIPSSSRLPNPRSISTVITCPYGTTSNIGLVTTTVSYGTGNTKAIHAVYGL